MNKILYYKKYIIMISSISLLLIFISLYVYFNNNQYEEIIISDNEEIVEITTQITTNDIIYVDVKGAVKKPGVYELTSSDKVIDAINKAGGLSSSASTNNINLSKKLTNEMVIYVFTKKELSTTTTSQPNNIPCNCETIEINNCIDNKESNTTTNIQTTKININTATKEQLITLNGIGESKAEAILEYRNTKGTFTKIEDILNVSGISNTIYEKIKENITV